MCPWETSWNPLVIFLNLWNFFYILHTPIMLATENIRSYKTSQETQFIHTIDHKYIYLKNSKWVLTPLPTLNYLCECSKVLYCEKFGRQVLTQRRQKSDGMTQVQERWQQDSSTHTFTKLHWNLFIKKSLLKYLCSLNI